MAVAAGLDIGHLVGALREAVVMVDADGTLRYANDAAGKLLGSAPADVVGSPWFEWLALRADDPVEAALRHGEHTVATALVVDRKAIPVQAHAKLVSATPPSIQMVLRDLRPVEELRHARDRSARLEARLQALQRLDESRQRMLNTASHELNTPLTPIRMHLHLLSSGAYGELNDKQQTASEIVQRNVERLSIIASNMLAVARLEDKKKPRAVMTHIAPLLDELRMTYVPVANEASLAWSVMCEPTVQAFAHADTVMQILHNLTTNAFKHTPRQGAVYVRAEDEGDWVAIEVEDSGRGMTEEEIGELFTPFMKLDDTRPGTGLGLFISRRLARDLNGEVTASSRGLGKGTTFTLRLPKAPQDS